MTAAAAGQVVSDVSGVVFGGTLERFLLQLSLIESPNLTSAQRRLSVCRNVSMAGAVCGVIVGCALGATTLLLVDLEKRHRIERAQQIQVIVGDMIALEGEPDEDDAGSSPQPESCNIYVTNADDFQIESDPERPRGRISLNLLSSSPGSASPALVRQCAAQGKALLSQDRSVLCVPVREDDQVLAVLELIKGTAAAQPPRLPEDDRRADGSGSDQTATRGFTDSDVRTAKVMARHLAIFMNRLVE
jgi:GAF domain-containing protein